MAHPITVLKSRDTIKSLGHLYTVRGRPVQSDKIQSVLGLLALHSSTTMMSGQQMVTIQNAVESIYTYHSVSRHLTTREEDSIA